MAGFAAGSDRKIKLLFVFPGPKDVDRPFAQVDDVNRLLNDTAGIIVIERQRPLGDIAGAMDSLKAGVALVWNGTRWEIVERSTAQENQQQQVIFAYQLAIGIAAGEPWQNFVIDLAKDEAEFRSNQSGQSNDRIFGYYQILRDGLLNTPIFSLSPPPHRYEAILVPRVIALLICFLPFVLSCNSIPRERDFSTLSVLLSTPNVTWNRLILGKGLLGVFLTFLVFAMLIVTSETTFSMSLGPSAVSIAGIAVLSILASTFLGLTASFVSRSQMQSYLFAALYLASLILLTGFIYPLGQGSQMLSYVSYLIPLTFFFPPLESSMLLGADASSFIRDVIGLVAHCVGYSLLAVATSIRCWHSL